MQLSYDPFLDELTINGMKFSGAVFKEWEVPTDRFFKFGRSSSGAVILTVVVPCDDCKKQF